MRYSLRLGFVLAVLAFFVNPVSAQFWDFEEDTVGSWMTYGGTAEIQDTLVYNGTYAVTVTADTQNANVGFHNDTFKELGYGDTLKAMVYVSSADTAAINGIQPFIQYGAAWAWTDQWYGAGDLQPDAWNAITFPIPAEAQDSLIQRFGIQLTGFNAADTPSMVVDYVATGPYPPTGAATWTFEDALGNWGLNPDMGGNISLVDSLSYSGSQSVRVSTDESNNQVQLKNDEFSTLAPGDTIWYKVYVSEDDTADINGIQPFMQYQEGWGGWASHWYGVGNMDVNDWTTMFLAVPEDVEGEVIQRIGIQMDALEASTTPAMFVDQISTIPYDETQEQPTVSAPSNVVVDSVGKSWVSLSWEASQGSGLSQYMVYRSTQSLFPVGAESLVDSTVDTTYMDTGLSSNMEYYYKITAVDQQGRETEPSMEIEARTDSFETHVTWDFEDGESGGWFANETSGIGGSISVLDTLAYSGSHAIKAEKAPDLSKIHLSYDNTDTLEVGHLVRFQVWVPEDTSSLDWFQPFVQYNNWSGWTGNVYNVGNLEPGAWNEVSIRVPDVGPLNRVGLEILYTESDGPPILVDFITTDPNATGQPTVVAPTNPAIVTYGRTFAVVSWSPPAGAVTGYRIYRSTQSGAALSEMTRVGGTTDTSYSDNELFSETTYYFRVTARDNAGRESVASEEVSVKTAGFRRHQTWDFEHDTTEFHTESGGSSTGTVEVTDSISYSGLHSVKLTTGAAETFFSVDAAEFPGEGIHSLEPGHWVRFYVWISEEDTAGITAFSPYFQNGSWGWSDTWVDMSTVEPNTWNMLAILIPSSTDGLNRIGIDVRGSDGNPESVMFIDMVTTSPSPTMRPPLTIPSGLRTSAVGPDTLMLHWNASTGRTDVEEYVVYRGDDDAEDMGDMEEVGTVSDTSFTDTGLDPDTQYWYAVSAVDTAALETFASAWLSVTTTTVGVGDETGIPSEFALKNNYPNPFNPTTQIHYDIPKTSDVTLKVYDITGRLVRTLVDATKEPGRYSVTFDARNLSSGIYFYRLKAASHTSVKRMVLVR